MGSRSILFDPTRIRSRIDWRNPPSGWITGSGRGPCRVPPLIFGGPWSSCLLVLRSPPSSCRSGRRCVVRGRKTFSSPSFLIWESTTLPCTFYSLRGVSCSWSEVGIAWRSAARWPHPYPFSARTVCWGLLRSPRIVAYVAVGATQIRSVQHLSRFVFLEVLGLERHGATPQEDRREEEGGLELQVLH